MKPLTRKEFFMAKAAGQSVPDLEPITREEYFLNQIAESGGGDSLPPIEEGDDGKVLTASDGEAVWASGGGGGGGATIVECVYDDDAHTITSSMTAKELWDAYTAGGAMLSYTDQGYPVYETILLAVKGGGNPGYQFRILDGGFSADADTDYPVETLE